MLDETIIRGKGISIRYENQIDLTRGQERQFHGHDCYEIVYLVEGSAQFMLNQKRYGLRPGEIVVMNPMEWHAFDGASDALFIHAYITGNFLQEFMQEEQITNVRFVNFLRNTLLETSEAFQTIRNALLQLCLIQNEQVKFRKSACKQLWGNIALAMLQNLIQAEADFKSQTKLNVSEVIRYIQAHITEGINLESLAKVFYLSPSYFSKLFSQETGISPVSYIRRIRLQLAIDRLTRTEESVIDIANSIGFNSLKTFETAFKSEFGTSPMRFRKIAAVHSAGNGGAGVGPSEYALLRKLLTEDSRVQNTPARISMRVAQEVEIDLSVRGKSAKNTWKAVLNVGSAEDLLHSTLQQRLRSVLHEIDYQYIHFHGLLDDALRVYDERDTGHPVFSFVYVDRVLDFILSLGARPYLELTWMPRALASSNHYAFRAYHSKPKSQSKWNALVRALMKHCIERYGREEVCLWLIKSWDSAYWKNWWNNDFQDFCRFYQATYQTLKKVDGKLILGAPSINSYSVTHAAWLERFLVFCGERNCVPDFLSLSVYPHDSYPGSEINQDGMIVDGHRDGLSATAAHLQAAPSISPNENYMRDVLAYTRKKLQNLGLSKLPIYISQWNMCNVICYHRDTVFGGPYVIKNICENYDVPASFGYWFFSDEREEYTACDEPFHGGLGVISCHGFKMPAYHAFSFLAKMHGRILYNDNGVFVRKDDNAIYLLLYHYVHPGRYDPGKIRRSSHYEPLRDTTHTRFVLSLKSVEAGEYRINEYIVNADHGSCYDIWGRMGAPRQLQREDAEYIEATNVPEQHISVQKLSDQWQLNRVLSENEFRLIVMRML